MSASTLFKQQASGIGTLTNDNSSYTLGVQFTVSKAGLLTAIWFYSASGATVLPGTIALYSVTPPGNLATGTLVHSETASWSGAAGSGWVRAAFTSPPSLATGTSYKAAVYQSTAISWYVGDHFYWISPGPGQSGITSADGVISAPNNAGGDGGQDSFIASANAYPNTSFDQSNYWIDPEVTTTPLTNDFESQVSGTAVTPVNSGGGTDNAFDTQVTGTGATNNYDSTHAAHGVNGNEIATGATSTTSYNGWSTSLGTPPATIYFRAYIYVTGTFASNTRVINLLNGTTSCGNILFKGANAGTLIFTNTAGSTILTSAALPLNQWIRIECQFTGSATVGQWIYKIWYTADSSGTPDDTQTSAATLNTFNPITQIRFGIGAAIASAGPYWLDDVGYSDTTWLGPAGAATQSGAAAFTAPGTLTAAAVVTELPSAAFTAPGSLTAEAVVTELPSAALAAPASLTAAGLVTKQAAASLAASPALTAAALVTEQAAAPLTAGPALTAQALVTEQAAASLSASASLTASAVSGQAGSVSLAAAPSLTVASVLIRPGAAALSSAPALSAAADLARAAVATLAASSALAVSAETISQGATVALQAAPSLSATSHVRPEGLWAIYVAAAEAAAAAGQKWHMYRSLTGGSTVAGLQYGQAFELENAADQAYQNWQAAYRAEFPGSAG